MAGDRVMPDAWLRIVLFALVLASFGGCDRPSVGEGTRSWLGFPKYPGARFFCEEMVDYFSDGKPSGGELTFFASREEAGTIATFYGASATADGGFEVWQPNGRYGRILSIHPIAAKHPPCAEKLRPGENTVIVVDYFYGVE